MPSNEHTTNKKKPNYLLCIGLPVLIGCIVVGAMVLLAMPSLENSPSTEYNKQRRADMVVLANAIVQYRTNNNGKFPTDPVSFKRDYITSRGYSFTDPDGVAYTIDFASLNEGETDDLPSQSYTMYVVTNAVCNDTNNKAEYSSNKNKSVILYHPNKSYTICSEL